MTLMEMIISLAIFAIMGVVLIGVGMHVDSTTKATTAMKDKIAVETPYAANRIKEFTDSSGNTVDLTSATENISVELPSVSGSYIQFVTEASGQVATDAAGNPQYNTITYSDPTCDMIGDKYSTKEIVDDAIPGKDSGELNFQFIEIETLPTT